MCGCVGVWISFPVLYRLVQLHRTKTNQPEAQSTRKKQGHLYTQGVFYGTFSGYERCNIQLGGKRKQTDKTTTNKTTKEVEHLSGTEVHAKPVCAAHSVVG